MSSGEFMDFDVAMRHVRDPRFVGNITFVIEDAASQSHAVAGYETILADRFAVDQDESGLSLVTFELGSTWDNMADVYHRHQHSGPDQLFVSAEIGMGSAATEYLMPFTKNSLHKKAQLAVYGYRPTTVKHSRSDRTSKKLTRRHGGTLNIANPFSGPESDPTDPDNQRITEHRIFMKKTWHGTV